jgi:peptidoglycan/LPS O-acetylase OafA/YrhL
LSASTHRAFRADINGLRAWAVIAVILFHFKIAGMDGGYVGVDIFFALSGFLMTGIISRALHNGAAAQPMGFFWNFFLARGKRIWPALLAMCAVLFVTGWFSMSAEEYSAYGAQARSAVLFFSNVKFWREAGYFGANAHSIWLLHTWSLSVEWQFYMVLPIAMLLAWKVWPSPRALLWLLIAGGALSFALCLVVAATKPGTAFFLLPCRAWEMIAGGLVALTSPRPPRSAALRHGLELGGLGLIAYSILSFGHLAWPDWRALVPVLGTVMVLVAAKENSVLTNWAPMRWIGERSYSMYLWHWPLVVWLYNFGQEHDTTELAVCLALTFALGHLSYVLVETRMRRPLDRLPRGAGTAVLAMACLAVIVPGVVIAKLGGLPSRLPAEAERMFAAAKDQEQFSPDCQILAKGTDAGCASGGAKLGVIVLGDSHGAALFDAVKHALPEQGMGAMRWSMEGCPAMFNVHNGEPGFQCERFMAWALQRLQTIPSSVPVVIINRGSMYMEGPNEATTQSDVSVPGIYFKTRYQKRTPEFYKEVRQSMVDTACTIAKHHPVYLVRPIPEMRFDVPNVVGHAAAIGKTRTISMQMSEYTKRHAQVWQAQNAARDQCGVTILDPLPYLCHGDRCDAVVDHRSLYFDDDHLSLYGAGRLTPMFSTMFEPRKTAAGNPAPVY